MDRNAIGYERLIRRISAWSEQNQDIRAALIIGSRAHQLAR
jgi:hypothetical protein